MTLTDNELTAQQILIIENRIAQNYVIYDDYKRYYEADNPTLIDAAEKKAPDNRVPCAFAGKIVDTLKGYMFKPGYITYKSKGKYAQQLKEIFDKNDEELKTAELGGDGLTYGVGYELLTVDETAKEIRQYRISPFNGYAVYDNTLAKKMIAFVHIVELESDSTEITRNWSMTIYYEKHFVTYESKEIGNWTETDRQFHPFGEVPAIEYRIGTDIESKTNYTQAPIFKKIIPMVDEHDKIISSNYANENERFANAYMLMLKRISTVKDANGKTDYDKLAELRLFDNLGSDGDINNAAQAVSFLTKPSRGSDIAESADRFERLIYDLAMVINPNDDNFAATSGIALKMKLLPMEFKAADIEAYFSKGLQRRIMLIGNAMQELYRITPEQVTISFRRNIPADIEAISVTAGNLKGILSDETIIGQFPADIVPDPKAELEKLQSTMTLDTVDSTSDNNDSSDMQDDNDEDDTQDEGVNDE